MADGDTAVNADVGRLLTGAGRFVDDIRLPGMLEAAFVRSLHAHAHILRVDTADALLAPGVAGALTAHDLGEQNEPLPLRFIHPGLRHPHMPRLLAEGVVRFVGEPVAVVLANSRYEAFDAADRVRVDYDALPAVVTIPEARRSGAPLVHAGAPGNVAGVYRWRIGNPDDAFLQAPVRLSSRFEISRGAAVPIETRGCIATYDAATGTLTLWASTQSPHYLQRTVAARTRLPEDRVRVVAPDVGGAFGVKGGAPREYVLAACLAMRTGRPVKWVEGRREHFLACQHDRDQVHHVELAATADGRLLALRDRFALDVGAYALYGHQIGIHTAAHLVGPYRLANLDVQFEAVYTNRVPAGAYRGAGRPQGTFVIERAVDQLARAIDLDPALVRERNLIPPAAMPWRTGLRQPAGRSVEYDSGDYPRLLHVALERFGYAAWRAEQQKRRAQTDSTGRLGIGLALYVQETAAEGHETVTLRMEPSGRVAMTAGPPSQGQGLVPILTRAIGKELAIPAGWVTIATGDTAAMAKSSGTHSSRVATVVGNAAAHAARDLALRLRGLAAKAIACAPDQIDLEDGRAVRRGHPGVGFAYAELLARAVQNGEPAALEVSAGFEPEGSAWSYGAHLVALEVDSDTGEVRVLRYLVVHDSGAVLDEEAVRRQILGGVAQGVGGSLYERLAWDEEGQPLVSTFADYAVPRAAQVPAVEIVRIETPSPHNPLGLKGAGESGVMAAYAAVAAAVEDAFEARERRVTALPLVTWQVWEMVRSHAGEA
jgi:carbon-monoxide dehydrogenase large subunit